MRLIPLSAAETIALEAGLAKAKNVGASPSGGPVLVSPDEQDDRPRPSVPLREGQRVRFLQDGAVSVVMFVSREKERVWITKPNDAKLLAYSVRSDGTWTREGKRDTDVIVPL